VCVWPLTVALGCMLALFVATLRLVHVCLRGRQPAVSLAGQVIVVTGAAGGFGQAVVPRLLQRGAVVYAVDVVAEDAIRKALDDAISKRASTTTPNTGDLVCISADLCAPGAAAAIARRVRAERGEVYCVLNNAGIVCPPGATVESADSDTRRVMDINFHAAAALTRECFPSMRLAKSHGAVRGDGTAARSRVVNVTSMAGLVSTPGMGAYNASKFALEAWSDATRLELHDALDVAIVEPFFAQTGIVQTWLHVPEEKLRASILADNYVKARDRMQKWKDGSKPIMTADFVADDILRAITDRAPQDRYVVTPNVAVRGVSALFMHLPNYFLLVDRMKKFISDRDV